MRGAAAIALVVFMHAQSGRTFGNEERQLQPGKRAVYALQIDPTNTVVVSGGSGGRISVDAIGRAAHVADLDTKSDYVMGVVFLPGKDTLVSVDSNGKMIFWDTIKWTKTQELTLSDDWILGIACPKTGAEIAACGRDHLIRVLPTDVRTPGVNLRGHDARVECLSYSPDAKTLASGDWDGVIKTWDTARHLEVGSQEAHTGGACMALAFSPDGRILASGGQDDQIRLWKSATLEPIATLRGHTSTVRDLRFMKAGQRLLSASNDGTVRLWEVIEFKEIGRVDLRERWVMRTAVTSDEGKLITGHSTGVIRIADLKKLF